MNLLQASLFQVSVGALLLVLTTQAWGEGQYIDIFPMAEEEISLVLMAVEDKLTETSAEPVPPIVMKLHGPEAERFLRSNYTKNQSLVDLGAKLSGYGLIDVKICETWMRRNNHDQTELFPFVSTVPFGPAELSRLRKEENYSEFALDL